MKHTLRIFTLLTLAVMLLSGCANTADAGNTLPSNSTTVATTTIDRDALTIPNLSEQETALRQSIWAAKKNTVPEDYTINDIAIGSFVVQCDDAFVCFFLGWNKNGQITSTPMQFSETIAGYEFQYGSSPALSVYANGKAYTLESAHSAGVLTEEEVRTVWEAYSN